MCFSKAVGVVVDVPLERKEVSHEYMNSPPSTLYWMEKGGVIWGK
jgi:hypothetical protein